MTIKRTKPGHTAARAKRQRPVAAKVARARSSDAGDTTSKPMLLGYARVSTVDQNLALQRDALAEAGCGQGSRIRDHRLSVMQGRATAKLHRR